MFALQKRIFVSNFMLIRSLEFAPNGIDAPGEDGSAFSPPEGLPNEVWFCGSQKSIGNGPQKLEQNAFPKRPPPQDLYVKAIE